MSSIQHFVLHSDTINNVYQQSHFDVSTPSNYIQMGNTLPQPQQYQSYITQNSDCKSRLNWNYDENCTAEPLININ